MTTIDFESDIFRNVRKMPTLFKVDHIAHVTLMEFNPSTEWIFHETAVPTFKKDGTSITVDADGKVFARRTVKKGKNAPEGFILAETDPNTGHSFGLEPIENSGFFKMFKSALARRIEPLTMGTYELVAPKINGNPEHVDEPTLLAHGADKVLDFPDMRDFVDSTPEKLFEILKPIFESFKENSVEGIVWWGDNGKRVKLRVKDFNFS